MHVLHLYLTEEAYDCLNYFVRQFPSDILLLIPLQNTPLNKEHTEVLSIAIRNKVYKKLIYFIKQMSPNVEIQEHIKNIRRNELIDLSSISEEENEKNLQALINNNPPSSAVLLGNYYFNKKKYRY